MSRLNSPIRLGPCLGILFGTVLAAFAASLVLPYDSTIRYHAFGDTIFADLGPIHDRIARDDAPIDVLFVGSSRTARIDAAAMEDALAVRGMPLRVVNAAIPAAGLDIRYSIARLALEHHPDIRMIVFGVVEALPRDGHQTFADLGTPAEILSAPWLINRNLPANIAQLPYRQIRDRLAARVPGAFGLERSAAGGYLPLPLSVPDDAPTPAQQRDPGHADTAEHAAALTAESRRRKREITPPVLPDALAGVEFGVSRHYVRRIRDLGAAHDARMAFSFLPFYDGYAEPLDAAWLRTQGPLWSADFIKDAPRNYIDAAHANDNGVALIVPWMADRIVALLENTP